MAEHFDPYYQWLGIPRAEHPPNHYRLLGLELFEDQVDVIATAADRQMTHVRSFQNGRRGAASQQLLAELAAAKVCLSQEESRAGYDAELSLQLLERGPEGPSADGSALGEYLLLDLLSSSDTTHVYLARHRTLKRVVALQTLQSRWAQQADAVAHFLRKAAILARFHHPHVVPIYDAGVRDKVPFLVLEHVSGDSLLRRTKLGSISPVQAIQWIKQAAGALAHIHAQRVVHRKVAPNNLLLDDQSTVRLIGFGMSLVIGGDELAPERPGRIVGHVDYIAPELATNSQAVDQRVDIYGLGGSLYTLLTGKAPYDGATPAIKIRQHCSAPLPQLPEHLAAVQPILQRMLAKRPEDRYESMLDVVAALSPLMNAVWPPVAPLGKPVPRQAPSQDPAPAPPRGATNSTAAPPTMISPPDRAVAPDIGAAMPQIAETSPHWKRTRR